MLYITPIPPTPTCCTLPLSPPPPHVVHYLYPPPMLYITPIPPHVVHYPYPPTPTPDPTMLLAFTAQKWCISLRPAPGTLSLSCRAWSSWVCGVVCGGVWRCVEVCGGWCVEWCSGVSVVCEWCDVEGGMEWCDVWRVCGR